MEEKTSIFDKIEAMYNLKDKDGKQKNKAFFSHLIRSYLGAKSVNVALKNPDSKKIRVKCVFTNSYLITVEEVQKKMKSEAFNRNLDEFLRSYDLEKGCFTSSTPMEQLLKGKTLALQGKDTKTYMSQESYLAFINWVMTKYLAGDPNIKWLLNQMTKNPFHPGIKVKRKSNKPKTYSTPGRKKSTFGDLTALQALRDKFKDEE